MWSGSGNPLCSETFRHFHLLVSLGISLGTVFHKIRPQGCPESCPQFSGTYTQALHSLHTPALVVDPLAGFRYNRRMRYYRPTAANSRPGVQHGSSKLTETDVRAIRRRHEEGERQAALAREFGLSRYSINHIVHFRTWQHVPDEPPRVGVL